MMDNKWLWLVLLCSALVISGCDLNRPVGCPVQQQEQKVPHLFTVAEKRIYILLQGMVFDDCMEYREDKRPKESYNDRKVKCKSYVERTIDWVESHDD